MKVCHKLILELVASFRLVVISTNSSSLLLEKFYVQIPN